MMTPEEEAFLTTQINSSIKLFQGRISNEEWAKDVGVLEDFRTFEPDSMEQETLISENPLSRASVFIRYHYDGKQINITQIKLYLRKPTYFPVKKIDKQFRFTNKSKMDSPTYDSHNKPVEMSYDYRIKKGFRSKSSVAISFEYTWADIDNWKMSDDVKTIYIAPYTE